MREFVLDGARMTDRKALHDYLQEALPLPAWYGRNLDALFDCLWEIGPCTVRLTNAAALRASMGDYGDALIRVFRDAADDEPFFFFETEE